MDLLFTLLRDQPFMTNAIAIAGPLLHLNKADLDPINILVKRSLLTTFAV